MSKTNKEFIFKSVDEHEHLIFGEVYSPLLPDSDGEVMSEADIKKMAHGFLKAHKLDQIDVQHNNELNPGASVVESFIARKGDNTFIEGSWVVGIHVPDNDTWAKIIKGEINGFSIEALVTKTPITLEMEIPPVVNGVTTKSDDHDHNFFVTFDAEGKFMGGRTSIEKGHFHNIRAGTITESEQNHNHRFSFVENSYTNPVQLASILKEAAECGVYPHDITNIMNVVKENPPKFNIKPNIEPNIESDIESELDLVTKYGTKGHSGRHNSFTSSGEKQKERPFDLNAVVAGLTPEHIKGIEYLHANGLWTTPRQVAIYQAIHKKESELQQVLAIEGMASLIELLKE